MIEVLQNLAVGVASFAFWRFLRTSRRTRCDCGRTVRFHFYDLHERHGWMIFTAVLFTVLTGGTVALLGPPWWAAAIMTLVSFHAWRTVYFHGKGRRKWPKRAAGLVRVNGHGRLVVENNR